MFWVLVQVSENFDLWVIEQLCKIHKWSFCTSPDSYSRKGQCSWRSSRMGTKTYSTWTSFTTLDAQVYIYRPLEPFLICLNNTDVNNAGCLLTCSGVSSFNRFIHELSLDSDTSILEYSSLEDDEEEDSDGISTPPSPLSQTSLRSWASLPEYYESHWTDWITFIVWLVLLPARILLWVPFYLLRLFCRQDSPMSPRRRYRRSSRPIPGKEHNVPIRTTDRRRGVIEVCVAEPYCVSLPSCSWIFLTHSHM